MTFSDWITNLFNTQQGDLVIAPGWFDHHEAFHQYKTSLFLYHPRYQMADVNYIKLGQLIFPVVMMEH